MENQYSNATTTEQKISTTQIVFFKNVLPLKEDEYFDEKDVEFHCKRCGGLRTYHNDDLGYHNRVRCLCTCQSKKLEERDILIGQLNKEKYIQNLKDESLLNELYKDVTFEKLDYNRDDSFVKACNFCMKYCDYPFDAIKQNYGLYIYGTQGVGKTCIMACMINKLTDNRFSCYITNFLTIQKELINCLKQRGYSEIDYTNKLTDVDFLFIDDLGTEKVYKGGEDTWLQEKIYDIINTRYNNKKPIIFSSNYSKNELLTFKSLENRTLDRINEMTKKDIKILGDSYRKIQRKNAKLPFEK